MKINKEKLRALAALPDDELWGEIVKVAAAYGFDMPKATPPHTELEKLRKTVTGEKINALDAMKILNGYRRGKQ